MSGHSKWSTIKHKKGIIDAKKGKVFSQISKAIRIAVKEGKSGDPDQNPTLRLAVEKARAANMPNQNVQRAIDRGLGKSASGRVIQEIAYEGFGPQGVAFVIVAMTENTQRTSANLRNILSKAGGSLGGPGSVMYMFERAENGDYISTMAMPVEDETLQQKVEDLMDLLREDEDVEDVYTSAAF